jgi:hypothetical protein
VDEDGYARTDKFDGLAESADQLIIHGIDGAFGWLLLIDKNSNEASMSFATADTTLAGFGTCSNKNKGEGQPLDPPIDRMDRSGGSLLPSLTYSSTFAHTGRYRRGLA